MNEQPFRRGDVVVCSLSGDYGKPRPALVVQSDLFNDTHASVVLCPISSEITGLTVFRIGITASRDNGLKKNSEVMVDKLTAASRTRIRRRIGHLSLGEIGLVDQALRIWLELHQTRNS